jgi:DNA-binding HxlR family transcriptional regulator
MRSGAQTLTLLADPLNVAVLRSLSTGPKRQVELRRESGSPAQSTLRSHLKSLEAIGAIARHLRNAFPGSLEYGLAEQGVELLFVAASLERWLDAAPQRPLELGSDAAKAAIKAFVDGWSTSMLRVLAARPITLTELDRVIGDLSYPSLERRLAAMHLVGQVTATPRNGKGTPYAVTDWLRQGVAPLVAASRWERRNQPVETPLITRLDAEAVFLLAVPLLTLPEELSGSCRIALEPQPSAQPAAGVVVAVKDGRIASCTTRIKSSSGAWASGSVAAWFRALIEADPDHIEIGGDCRLARNVLERLHVDLFGSQRSKAPGNDRESELLV